MISFGRYVFESTDPALFPTTSPDIFWSYVVAPFWANFNATQYGNVSWEIHDISQSPDLLNQVNNFIQVDEGINFTGTWMMIGFWEELHDSEVYTNVRVFFCRHL